MFLKAIKKAVLPVLIGSLLTGPGCRITYGYVGDSGRAIYEYAGKNSWDTAVLFLEDNTGDNTSDTDTQQENASPQIPATDDTLIQAPSALLMEATTGTVIYEKDPDTRRSPASITKIMTLILIFDALENGTLKMTDTVTTSAYAKSMGGSQVFLEEGETQDVETMIKCIAVASGNDASVAVAGFLAGWLEKHDYRHAFHTGIAAGSASAFSEYLASREEVQAVYEQVTSKEYKEQ